MSDYYQASGVVLKSRVQVPRFQCRNKVSLAPWDNTQNAQLITRPVIKLDHLQALTKSEKRLDIKYRFYLKTSWLKECSRGNIVNKFLRYGFFDSFPNRHEG